MFNFEEHDFLICNMLYKLIQAIQHMAVTTGPVLLYIGIVNNDIPGVRDVAIQLILDRDNCQELYRNNFSYRDTNTQT